MGTLDRKRRLAWAIAKDRQLDPVVVGTWVVVADSRTNRRTVAEHRAVLRAKLPTDGRGVARWLRRPAGRIDALSFLPGVQGMHLGVDPAPIRRVSKAQAGRKRLVPSVD
jgi:hypothetical protein